MPVSGETVSLSLSSNKDPSNNKDRLNLQLTLMLNQQLAVTEMDRAPSQDNQIDWECTQSYSRHRIKLNRVRRRRRI